MNRLKFPQLSVFCLILAIALSPTVAKYLPVNEMLELSLNQTKWEQYQLLFESGSMVLLPSYTKSSSPSIV